MADPNIAALSALRRLRHVETDTARRDLAEAIAHEASLVGRDDALRRELDDARLISGDFDRQVFVAWFRRMRSERAKLADAIKDAETRTATCRATLAHGRVAETVAEDTLAGAILAKQAKVAHRDQVMLEDIARALKRASA